MASRERLRIAVLGYVVRGPIGGMAWHHLQYVVGLRALGHDVLFVEDSDDYPSCYDPSRHVTDVDPSYGLDFAARSFKGLGAPGCWAYHDAHAGRWHGPAGARAEAFGRDADLLLNVSGVNPLRPWCESIPVRVLVDTDPVFTQIRHLKDAAARSRAAGHTAFLSFGESFGGQHELIPDDGFPWFPTRQPVVLEAWPFVPAPVPGRFTTVMQWDSYAPLEHAGQSYGTKSRSFAAYAGLPARTGADLELALGGPNAPRSALREQGWGLCDPLRISRDLFTYRAYIQGSAAEFSVAKHGYVVARSGWFSERSACYLASGRPVVVQDTGLASTLPVGKGLLTFSDADGALGCVEAVLRDPGRHAEAAREIAREHFDARRVLSELLDRVAERGGP